MLNFEIQKYRIKRAYHIGFLPSPPQLVLEVSDWALELAGPRLVPDTPAIKVIAGSYDLMPDVVLPSQDVSWGWGNVFKATNEPLLWIATIPRDDSSADEWEIASRKLLASLQLILLPLLLVDNPPRSESYGLSEQQLLTLEILRWDGLSVNLSRDLVFWLSERSGHSLPLVSLTMRVVYSQLSHHSAPVFDFDSEIGNDGALHLTIPGDRCGLDPDFNRMPGRGYELQPHNVDSPIQALTLVAGLARLCDLALASD